MNRRKLFGFLAAAPVVVAYNRPVVPIAPVTTMVHVSELGVWPKPRLYSEWDYEDIFKAWVSRYLKSQFVASPISIDALSSIGVFSHLSDCYFRMAANNRDGVGIQASVARELFADACLAGEVPGVYWA